MTGKIDRKAAREAYKNAITPMGIYCLRDTVTGRCVIAAERNLNSAQSRFQFLMRNNTTPPPGGPLSDPQLLADYRDHAEAFQFEILEEVDTAKCASYEEAANRLAALWRDTHKKYASWPQYHYK